MAVICGKCGLIMFKTKDSGYICMGKCSPNETKVKIRSLSRTELENMKSMIYKDMVNQIAELPGLKQND